MPGARLLHVHSTFDPGGKELRTVRLINALGRGLDHTLLTGEPQRLGALGVLDQDARFSVADIGAPPLLGRPGLARYRALAEYMRGFDLVLSYSWGAMDLVMAHRMFAGRLSLPPLIHHEDGFDEDEAVQRSGSRNLFRRIALPTAQALVVPSGLLHTIARREWGVPANRIELIDNGIDLNRFIGSGRDRGVRSGPVVVGTVAGLRAVKNLTRLVRATAMAGNDLRLVIAGEGPDRPAIEAEIARCRLEDRVTLLGHRPDPSGLYPDFDIFALSSDSEQAPIALVEAMAAGLPVVSTDVGDVAEMISAPNQPFVRAREDLAGLADALRSLASDAPLRRELGRANATKAKSRYDQKVMFARYAALFGKAVGRKIA